MLSEVAHARARAILLVAALAPPAVLLRFVITDSFDGGRVASSNSALPPSLASNFLGTALLGALSAFGSVLPNALNAGLASGFCASLTTFGSAMFHAARLFVIGLPERGFTSLMLTLFSAPSIYVTVRDAASLIRVPALPSACTATQRNARVHQWIMTTMCAFICAAVFISSAIAVALYGGSLWRAAILAPFGAVLRYLLSVYLNRDNFPHGTLLSNILACVADAVLAALLYRTVRNINAQSWLNALFMGFGGSLGTVSAFAAELTKLAPGNRILYGFVSLLAAQAIFIVIFGAVVWSE